MKTGNTLKTTLSNNLFLLKYLWKFAPSYLVLEAVNAVIQGLYSSIIKVYNKIYYDALSEGRSFLSVLFLCIAVFVIYASVELFRGYYMQVLRESKKQKLKLGMTVDLFGAATDRCRNSTVLRRRTCALPIRTAKRFCTISI